MNLNKPFIVHTSTEKECIAVQRKFFDIGVEWSGRNTHIMSVWEKRGPDTCIRFVPRFFPKRDRSDVGVLKVGSREFYEDSPEHWDTPIIKARDFLKEQISVQMRIIPVGAR